MSAPEQLVERCGVRDVTRSRVPETSGFLGSMRRRCRTLLPLGLMLAVPSCVSAPKVALQAPAPAAPSAPPLDASYDWHVLLQVPFGSMLKEMPFTMREVLLFGETSRSSPTDAECYAPERTAPRFLSRIPTEYLLCFKHDRLMRVEATVELPRSEANRIFDEACGLWRRNASVRADGRSENIPIMPAGACEGRDGDIGYGGTLDEESDQDEIPVTIHLDSTVEP